MHSYIRSKGNRITLNAKVGNALIDMYYKCGSLEDARQVLYKMPNRNAVCWTALIAGYALQGDGVEVMLLVEQMQQDSVQPNHVTFVNILSSCSHAGLVDVGHRYFDLMSQDHAIVPSAEHYACMVDNLGRAGHLEEAQNIAKTMPLPPSAVVWRALLGACRIHGNVELAKHAAENFLLPDSAPAPWLQL